MVDRFGQSVRARRLALGLTQTQLGQRAGLPQPVVSAIESGARSPTEPTRKRLTKALRARPGWLLRCQRHRVIEIAADHGVTNLKVFGSIARGTDHPWSDVDLIGEYPSHFDLLAKARLVEELEAILTVPVDLIGADSTGAAAVCARQEALVL